MVPPSAASPLKRGRRRSSECDSQSASQNSPNNVISSTFENQSPPPPLKYKRFDKRPAKRIPLPRHSKLKNTVSSTSAITTRSRDRAKSTSVLLTEKDSCSSASGVAGPINKEKVTLNPLSANSSSGYLHNYDINESIPNDSSVEISANIGCVNIDPSLENLFNFDNTSCDWGNNDWGGILDSEICSQEEFENTELDVSGGDGMEEIQQHSTFVSISIDAIGKEIEISSENLIGHQNIEENGVQDPGQIETDLNQQAVWTGTGERYPNKSNVNGESVGKIRTNVEEPLEAEVFQDEESNKSTAETETGDELKPQRKRSWCSIS